MSDGSRPGPASGGPSIALVTPAFNAGKYIESTLSSVLTQGYDRLEYVVVDGGSSDNTVDAIRARESDLTAWVSEPDEGMYDAINKGFAKTSGEVMGWINADDVLLPGTLATVGEVFGRFPEIEWISTRTPAAIDERGSIIKINRHAAFSAHGFARGVHFVHAGWPAECFLQQEGTFWRRSLWNRAGGKLDASYKLAGDFELWCRFAQHAELVSIDVPLGLFRYHPEQASGQNLAKYLEEARRAYAANGYGPPTKARGLVTMAKKLFSDGALHWFISKGVLHRSPRLTYDWGARVWSLERPSGRS
ncbi:MAG: glycosyltransferase family 2 protein [Planctomycetota bacterium]